MMKKKQIKRLCILGLTFPLIFMSLSGTEAHAMKTVDDYDASLLFQLDFNQNDFVERVTKRSYTPSSLTGFFNEGIRYNSYAFNANKLIVPLTDVKADVENELTFSLWWYPELLSGNERILSVDDFGLQYNSTAKAFELVDGSNRVIQQVSQNMTSSKWAHLTISLNRQDIQKNKLAINGTNAPLTVITSGVTPTWSPSSQLVLNGSKSGSNGMTNGSRLDEVEIRKGIFTGTDATDVSRLAFVPDLNGEVMNGNPHLSWSNDIMPEDVIIETSFEDGQMIPTLGVNPGGQEIVDTGSYSGSKSIKVTDTYTNGNHFNYPATSSTKSIAWWQRLFVPSGTDLSVTYYAKAEQENAIIAQNGDGGWGTSFSSIPVIKLTQPVSKGVRELFVDNVASYTNGTHITFDEDANSIGTYYTIESVNSTTKTITLRSGVNTAYPVGKEIRNRPWRGAFSFGSRTVTALPEWQRISQNTKVNNFADYDVLVRGASFYTNFTTKGVVRMDNIKLGYATKVKLFRGDTLLYEGLLSDYRDTASKDIVAPSSVSVKKVNRTREKVDVSFTPAVDTGSTYGYRVQSVSNDGKGTPLSKEVEVEVLSGIKGYSYVLDNFSSTVPNNIVNTTATSVSLVANDSNYRYLHVKAIDNAGNAGATIHIKIPVPQLQVQADTTGTFVTMNWSMELATEGYDYKVYKRKKGEVAFQSISTLGQTGLTDYSSIDDTKADTVPSLSYKKVSAGVYDISFPTVQDNGTTYEYYVEAIGKATGSIYQSAIVEETVMSGVKGYRVDVSVNSEVPVNVQVQSKTSPVRVTVPNSSLAEEPEFYIHVKAIDGAENTSVFTKRLDSATSFLVITPSEPDWTNKPVVLSIRGSEALGQIKEIYLPDGTVIKSPTASYTVSENGNYAFKARDEFGQWIAGGFTVINIDNGTPEIDIPNLPTTWTNKDIEVKINAK